MTFIEPSGTISAKSRGKIDLEVELEIDRGHKPPTFFRVVYTPVTKPTQVAMEANVKPHCIRNNKHVYRSTARVPHYVGTYRLRADAIYILNVSEEHPGTLKDVLVPEEVRLSGWGPTVEVRKK